MRIVDDIVLSPEEFEPNGAELNLSDAGFMVLDADFGETDIEVAMQKAALGEMPVGWHPTDTQTVLKLIVREEGEVDLPTAGHLLQMKVGELCQPGTERWMRRDFIVGGKFAGSLAKQVKNKAVLSGFTAWQRGECPDVVLTMTTSPYWYATLEVESEEFEETEARELVFELAEVLGTHPGLIRIRVNNLGKEHWRGLIFAAECRDHPQDETAETTAALAYDAADLTLKGGAEVKSGVVEASLTAGWLTILNSEIAGVGHMTHKGVRRPWVRAEDTGEEVGDVQLRLRWRPLGSLQWSENGIVPSPVVDAMQWLDMGECRPQQAALGDERWEWELEARALSGSGKVKIERVAPLPVEQFMVLEAPGTTQAADAHSTKSPGTVTNKNSLGGGKWENPDNAKASDDSRATAKVEKVELSPKLHRNLTQELWATSFGLAIDEDATITGVMVELERSAEGEGNVQDETIQLIKAGAKGGDDKAAVGAWPTSDEYVSYGGSTDLWGLSLTPANVNSANFGVAVACTGSTTATARVDHVRITVYYTEAEDENRICFAERSIELRTDGPYRQHPTDEVWGYVVPRGFLPYATPSGMEGRKTRFIVIPTQGDLGELPDSGSNKVGASANHRPAYLSAREAES